MVLQLSALCCVFVFAGIVSAEDPPSSPVTRVEILRPPTFDDVGAFTDRDVRRIDAWLEEQVELAAFPSLSVAVVRKGQVVYRRAFGLADLAVERRATPETAYHVASVTKVVATTLAAVLDERGVVDLDAPVARYLPRGVRITRTPDVGGRITLRQLASHTSGLPRDLDGPLQSVDDRYQLEPKRLYDQLAEIEFDFEPGTDDRYSNLGLGLLGHALERAAGVPLERLVDHEILAPLQMRHSAMAPAPEDDIDIATGYGPFRPRIPYPTKHAKRLMASGGMVASAPDLARFLAAQMEPGVFSKEVLTKLRTPTRLADGSTIHRGLGWRFVPNASIGWYASKNGGRINCRAWVGFAPAHGVGVAVLTNCGGPGVDEIGQWLLERSVAGVKPALLSRRPVVERHYAKVAPFTGVRWVKDRPEVRVDGRWSRLASIDGMPTKRITDFADTRYGSMARRRFAEDLVRVLSEMGHDPGWSVTLGLESAEGEIEEREARMTAANRTRVRNEGRDE